MKISKSGEIQIPKDASVFIMEAKGAQHELLKLLDDCIAACSHRNCDEVAVRQISSYFDLRDETLSWTIKVIGVKYKSI